MNLEISTIAVMAATVLFSCNQGTKTTASTKTEEANQVVTHVMTKEEQAKLTPDQVLQQFIDGNNLFGSDNKPFTNDAPTDVLFKVVSFPFSPPLDASPLFPLTGIPALVASVTAAYSYLFAACFYLFAALL